MFGHCHSPMPPNAPAITTGNVRLSWSSMSVFASSHSPQAAMKFVIRTTMTPLRTSGSMIRRRIVPERVGPGQSLGVMAEIEVVRPDPVRVRVRQRLDREQEDPGDREEDDQAGEDEDGVLRDRGEPATPPRML